MATQLHSALLRRLAESNNANHRLGEQAIQAECISCCLRAAKEESEQGRFMRCPFQQPFSTQRSAATAIICSTRNRMSIGNELGHF